MIFPSIVHTLLMVVSRFSSYISLIVHEHTSVVVQPPRVLLAPHDDSLHDGSLHDGSLHDGSLHDGSLRVSTNELCYGGPGFRSCFPA